LLIILFACLFSVNLFSKPPDSSSVLINELGCGNCHEGISPSNDILNKVPDLTLTAVAYKPDFIFNYLKNPTKLRNIDLTRMPNFKLSDKEALALTLYLVSLVPDSLKRTAQDYTQSLEKIKSISSAVQAKDGKRIFQALNCVACHRPINTTTEVQKIAPDLSIEGSRVKRAWLESFLKKPYALRPFGNKPGSGSRMPDFNLSDNEVKIISNFLMTQKKQSISNSSYKVTELSPFLKLKAQKLFDEKLPCLGCHEFNGNGGRIGPNLTSVDSRLKPEYVYEIISDPQQISKDIIMPKIKMRADYLKLIADYLNQLNNPSSNGNYLSLIDNETIQYDEKTGSEKDYLKYCANCHGADGNGDGYNAKYLPKSPTHFSDTKELEKIPDDILYDGIYAGGYILNKSHLMPSWGFTLTNEEITDLVKYIRKLCNCKPPKWSTDN
jgi:mono/diheme cytochrome c family protein